MTSTLSQIYLMDEFLGGQFTTYGTEVLAISEQPIENRVDPMAKVFPKVRFLKSKINQKVFNVIKPF